MTIDQWQWMAIAALFVFQIFALWSLTKACDALLDYIQAVRELLEVSQK